MENLLFFEGKRRSGPGEKGMKRGEIGGEKGGEITAGMQCMRGNNNKRMEFNDPMSRKSLVVFSFFLMGVIYKDTILSSRALQKPIHHML